MIQSLWNPFRDWNISDRSDRQNTYAGFKASETLLGIETIAHSYVSSSDWRFKASETLLGIETKPMKKGLNPLPIKDSKPLKPF